nr:hypothetical protein [Sphingomonas sp. SCN 67-18]
MAEWLRLAANAINGVIRRIEGGAVELKPMALPADPAKGTTVYDVADDKVKTWDGATWQAHF